MVPIHAQGGPFGLLFFSISITAVSKDLHIDKLPALTNSRCHDISHGFEDRGLHTCTASENFAPHANVPIVLSDVLCEALDLVESIFERKPYTHPVLVCDLPTRRLVQIDAWADGGHLNKAPHCGNAGLHRK